MSTLIFTNRVHSSSQLLIESQAQAVAVETSSASRRDIDLRFDATASGCCAWLTEFDAQRPCLGELVADALSGRRPLKQDVWVWHCLQRVLDIVVSPVHAVVPSDLDDAISRPYPVGQHLPPALSAGCVGAE